MKKIILTIAALLSMTTMAYAIPSLQLDIAGGSYVNGTIVAPGSSFTLYPYLLLDGDKQNPRAVNFLADTYFLSMAIIPKLSTAGSYGSFSYSFDNTSFTKINVTTDMTYGNPPIESYTGDARDRDFDLVK